MASPAPTTELNVQLIALENIETRIQVRPVDKDHVARLASSMKEHGQLVPIVVHMDGGVLFRLGPGRHRLEAARKLGWSNIAAIVKKPANDNELRAEQVRENLERKDLTPLEEGELCEALLTELGGNVAEAAAIMARGAKWVEQRAALMRLSPKVRAWILDGSLPLSHAQLIARLPDAEQQQDVADQVRSKKSRYHDDVEPPQSIGDVRHLVDQRGRDLGYATWELDAVFGEANRACSTCPFNSANTRGLFDGDAPKKGGCLESKCFHDKMNLASRAARKSANFLDKEKLKATPANAQAARDAREVPFVKVKAVLDAADQKPAKKKGPSAGASAGAPEKVKSADQVAKDKLHSALGEWERELATLVEKALKGKPLALALVKLLELTPAASRWNAKPKDLQALVPMARKIAKVDGATLLEVAKHLDTSNVWFDELPTELLEVIGVELQCKTEPKPTLESIKAAIAKDAEAAKAAKAKEDKSVAKPAAKKKGKKKATKR